MARAVWSGAVSFGLVNVPVKAYTAVRDHTVHFHQIQKKTGARIRYKKVSESSGREIEGDNIELGYEVRPGELVRVDPDELDELRPKTTRTIDISEFVALADIDPIYYERTYWLAPGDVGAGHAYSLLVAAMEHEGRIGIGTVVMRRKQYLAAIRPLDGALAMSTMRFADEVVDRSDIDALPARQSKPKPKELKLATSIIDALADDWKPERYHDTYNEEARDIITRRAKGETIKAQAAPEETAEVVDLMAALEASLSSTKKKPHRSSSSRKRAPARKAARKRASA